MFKLIVFVLQPTALLFWFTFTASSQPCFPDTAAVLSEKAVNTHCTLPALQQAAITQNSSSLLNIAEHLAAQEPDFFFLYTSKQISGRMWNRQRNTL